LEKDALKGVLMPTVVDQCGLRLHVTRGFASITYLQDAAEEIERDGRLTFVYVLTDFDPSGVVIAEKVEEELRKRAPRCDITVVRLAVSRDQIERGGTCLRARPRPLTPAPRRFARPAAQTRLNSMPSPRMSCASWLGTP
jgi:hypothetical protein